MSVAKIQKNIEDLQRKATKSNKIVAKGDKIGYSDAIKLGQKSNSITSTIRKTIKEYDGAEPTEAESKDILKKMETLVNITEEQLDLLVKNKGRFETLKVGGLVKKNMTKTGEASADLEKVMLSKTPNDIKPQATALAARREVAFGKATAAFANAVGGEDQADGEDESD